MLDQAYHRLFEGDLTSVQSVNTPDGCREPMSPRGTAVELDLAEIASVPKGEVAPGRFQRVGRGIRR